MVNKKICDNCKKKLSLVQIEVIKNGEARTSRHDYNGHVSGEQHGKFGVNCFQGFENSAPSQSGPSDLLLRFVCTRGRGQEDGAARDHLAPLRILRLQARDQ